MSRRKRSSTVLEKVERRISGMMTIKEDLDFGDGLSFEAFKISASDVREKQQQYNAILSEVDGLYNDLMQAEEELGEMADHMLSAVKARFGRDSSQYEKAGGVRRSERKRLKRSIGQSAKNMSSAGG